MKNVKLAVLLALCLPALAQAAPSPIVIATGPVSGFAYPLGGEICRLFERLTQDKARCTTEATDGSVENLNRLRSGDVGLAIVQSDVAAEAVAGTGSFSGTKPFQDLRAIAGFYAQVLTIIVKSDGPIKTVDDLKGKRIAVGEPGANDPLFAEFLEGLGWSKADLGGIAEIARSDQVAALCGDKVAAIMVTAPHPNGFVRGALAACGATILDLAGSGIDAAVTSHPAYGPTHIELSVYGGASHLVQTFGTRAVLVSTAKFDDETVKRLLTGLFDHIEDLRKSHPAFAGFDIGTLSSGGGLGVERHPAASQYLLDHKVGDPTSGG